MTNGWASFDKTLQKNQSMNVHNTIVSDIRLNLSDIITKKSSELIDEITENYLWVLNMLHPVSFKNRTMNVHCSMYLKYRI